MLILFFQNEILQGMEILLLKLLFKVLFPAFTDRRMVDDFGR